MTGKLRPISVRLALILPALTVALHAQTFQVLYNFPGGAQGGNPWGTLAFHDGALFGTNTNHGAPNFGTVFRVDAQNGQYSVLHSFHGRPIDGAYSHAGIIRDSAGNLYGTTRRGGVFDMGTVFRIDPSGTESLLYLFTGGSDGALPQGDLVLDAQGNLYGAASDGGAFNRGTIFKVDPTGKLTTLYTFGPAPDGANPAGGLRLEGGILYGVTIHGGGVSCPNDLGCGTVFSIDPATGQKTQLYSFTGGMDGRYPLAGLAKDGKGDLYGTTASGGDGPLQCGVVFKVNIATGQETVVHAFTGADGCVPMAGLMRDRAGNYYGTTHRGGLGSGTVFKVDASGHFTTLHSFTLGADGGNPRAGLALDPAGNLYGTTKYGGSGRVGTIFKVTP